MFARVLIPLLLALLIGCGKQPSPTESQASGSTNAPDLTQLTQAVRKYAAEQQRAPKSLDELVSAGYLSSLPSAPQGKHLAINKSLQVYLTE